MYNRLCFCYYAGFPPDGLLSADMVCLTYRRSKM
jgi:hypothetical protein